MATRRIEFEIKQALISEKQDVTSLEALMHAGELVDSQWPLAYEANMKGWLPNIGGTDFVTAHKYFGLMKAAGFSFYDEAATLPIIVKPVVLQDYGSADKDLDFHIEYLFGSVSW